MSRSVIWIFALMAAGFAGRAISDDTQIQWERIQLDSAFRAEGVTVADFNQDGRPDIVNGEAWYEAPGERTLFASGLWTMRSLRAEGIRRYVDDNAYSNSFALWPYDVSGDGWMDVIVIGFPGVPCHWFENPQGKPGPWNQFEIWRSVGGESPQFGDLNGDGQPELVITSEPEQMIGYLEIPDSKKAKTRWVFHPVNGEKIGGLAKPFYHGLGIGDLNRDGRPDLLLPAGWWEQPAKIDDAPWTFHQHVLNQNGEGNSHAAADLYTDDLDGDGDNDILMSSAHAHGVWWFENRGSGKFIQHEIDSTFSQTHALQYHDINGDGVNDLITGKRYYAHGSKGDPDPLGEVVMIWYEVRKGVKSTPQFIRHKIEAGTDTGIGTQFYVGDINGDQLPDIALSNKKGTNLLIQKRGSAAE